MDDYVLSPEERYSAFAREIVASNIIGDPWIYGHERFRVDPVVLGDDQLRNLYDAAEAIARTFDEAARLVWERPELLDGYFHLTPWQKMMWLSSGARWHGIARADLFVLPDGTIRCCEVNSDTPSGEAEAVILNGIARRDYPDLADPNTAFEERFVSMLLDAYESTARSAESAQRIGIVYPTDLPEDLSMITLYRSWLESRGFDVVLGGPGNLGSEGGRLTLMGMPVDIIIRHYKTDWWGEREPAWIDEPEYEDPEPLERPLQLLLDADARGIAAIVNPFGSVITQNKLLMAFIWDHLDDLTPESAVATRRYIPETRPLDNVRETVAGARLEWVLKSDYGCEGDEVILGPAVTEEIWRESIEKAKPGRWIAQRFFAAETDASGAIANYGVYLLGGLAAGIYTRLSSSATDTTALTAPTLISK